MFVAIADRGTVINLSQWVKLEASEAGGVAITLPGYTYDFSPSGCAETPASPVVVGELFSRTMGDDLGVLTEAELSDIYWEEHSRQERWLARRSSRRA